MIIHIGDGVSILKRDILAILDIKNVERSMDNQNYINDLISKGYLMNRVDKVACYIITREDKIKDKNNIRLYVSNISSTSLCSRQDLGRRETNE